MKNKALREFIIFFVITIVIIFAFGILFYDYILVYDEKTVYSITENNFDNMPDEINFKSEDKIIQSYSVEVQENKEESYESGKKDPFASLESEGFYENKNSK